MTMTDLVVACTGQVEERRIPAARTVAEADRTAVHTQVDPLALGDRTLAGLVDHNQADPEGHTLAAEGLLKKKQ